MDRHAPYMNANSNYSYSSPHAAAEAHGAEGVEWRKRPTPRPLLDLGVASPRLFHAGNTADSLPSNSLATRHDTWPSLFRNMHSAKGIGMQRSCIDRVSKGTRKGKSSEGLRWAAAGLDIRQLCTKSGRAVRLPEANELRNRATC